MTEAREEEAPRQRQRLPAYLFSLAVVSLIGGFIPRLVRRYGVGLWLVIGLGLGVMLAIAWPSLMRRPPAEPHK